MLRVQVPGLADAAQVEVGAQGTLEANAANRGRSAAVTCDVGVHVRSGSLRRAGETSRACDNVHSEHTHEGSGSFDAPLQFRSWFGPCDVNKWRQCLHCLSLGGTFLHKQSSAECDSFKPFRRCMHQRVFLQALLCFEGLLALEAHDICTQT